MSDNLTHRPPIRPYATGHVVDAVSVAVLSPGVKAVWHVVHRFDRRPTGCELSASRLAPKLGMSPRTVEKHITTLQGMGLLFRIPKGGLAATVPEDCVPKVARPGWQETEELARRLEQRIQSTPTGVPDVRPGAYTAGPSEYAQGRTSQAQNPAQVSTPSGVCLGVVGEVGVTTPAGGIEKTLTTPAGGTPGIQGCCAHHPERPAVMVWGRGERLCRGCADER